MSGRVFRSMLELERHYFPDSYLDFLEERDGLDARIREEVRLMFDRALATKHGATRTKRGTR